MTAVDYLQFDPAPYAFPPPAWPMLPPVSWPRRGPGAAATPAWDGQGRLYARARYALRDAYRLSGVGPQGGLLAPSYHCRTMLDAALALGAPVSLFALHPDLRPDLADVELLLRDAAVPVRAVLMPHYFGMVQDLRPLADLCRTHGADLVEDCAHALPLRSPANGMGRTGRWCVASPYKFFACGDGGALWAGDGSPLPALPPLRPPGWRDEWRRLSSRRRRHDAQAQTNRPLPDATLDERQRQALARPLSQAGPSDDYLPGDADLTCTRASRWIIRHTDIAAMLARRRRHHAAWAAGMAGLPQAQALRPALQAADTPYMFALQISEPATGFAALKRAGVPIYRWDVLAVSHCATAARARLGLLQLPCHQGLSDADMDGLIHQVRQVLAALPPEAAT